MATNQYTPYRVKPGDLVVSLKEVLDRIGTRLTEKEKDDILTEFLARRRQEVKPGDLITAELWNQILADIARLNLRIEQLEETPATPPDATPPGNGTEVKTGTLMAVVLGEKQTPLGPKEDTQIWVEDTNGKKIHHAEATSVSQDELKDWGDPLIFCKELADAIKSRGPKAVGDVLRKVLPAKVPCYRLTVPPGAYRLKATATQHGTATGTLDVTEGMKRTAVVCLSLKAKEPPKGEEPPKKEKPKKPKKPHGDVRSQRGDRYRKIRFAEVLDLPRPPEEMIPWWKDRVEIDPGPDVREWVEEELQGFLDEDPDMAFTAENPKIYLDPGYSPDDVADTDYAVVQTGDGALISLILTPAELALPRSTSIERSGIPDLEAGGPATAEGLGALRSMDVFASATAGMVSRALDVSLQSARTLITEMRARVGEAIKTRAYYPGLTPEASGKLTEKGLDNDIKLANAHPKVVAEAAGVSESMAVRLIDYARQLTPEEAWSIRRADLGLDNRQYRELNAMQIASLGQLQKALSDTRTAAALKSKLEMNDTSFDGLTRAVDAQAAILSVAAAPESSLRSLKNVDRGMAAKLVAGNLTSVSELASAPLDRISAALGVPEAQALKVRSEAMTATLTARFGLNPEDATKIVRAVGTEKLAEAVTRDDFPRQASVSPETASRVRLGIGGLAKKVG